MGVFDDLDDIYRKMGKEPPPRPKFNFHFEMPDLNEIFRKQEEQRVKKHKFDQKVYARRRAEHNKEWHWKNMQKEMPTNPYLRNSGFSPEMAKYAKFVPGKKTYAATGTVVFVGAAGYGGYRLHKHFKKGKSQSKSYYYRKQNGKQVRVRNTKRK